MSYDNTGKASIWKRDYESPKAPAFSGDVYAHRDIKAGELFEIALWENDNPSPKAPIYTGRVSDKKERPQTPAKDDDFSDEVPF